MVHILTNEHTELEIIMIKSFSHCSGLTTATAIPSSVTNMGVTFENCTFLTGTITVNANPTSYSYCLYGTQVTAITGTCTEETKTSFLATKGE